ncbi:MAG: AMP-binding protein, partial [Gammaproteobacteria bacterium]|nr:AMP-binding protein [Gammaproteobacteria bacterium]
MSYNWNYGDIVEAMETITPGDQPALIHGDRVVNWSDMKRRSNNLANNLLANGVKSGDKIAFYLRNCPEYSEGLNAAFKAGLTHVNVNYRYIDHELVYLLDNSDATVVIYQTEFQEHVDHIRDRLPNVLHWLAVDSGNESSYEDMVNDGDGTPCRRTRSPHDLLFMYTGGTTGMPKGVMWRHDDLFKVLGAGGNARINIPPCADMIELKARTQSEPRTVNMPLPPIMHGTGLLSAIGAMASGGTCVTLPSRSFDADLALTEIDKHRVTTVSIVG